ncbi:MAG: type II secretion system F family protein [Halanaerobiales bacterium]|nr:type II secretion system F family protein [Halanaerobiales bacterium]
MSPLFDYEARNKNGVKTSGILEADDPTQLAKQLRAKGFYVTAVHKKKEKKGLAERFSFSRGIKTDDLAVFSQQFSAMIDAGISLVEALNILQEQTDHPKLKTVINEVQDDVSAGSGLSEAMKKHDDVFPELYCQLVRAGEAGGVLDQVLKQLSEHYERQAEINSKVRSALYYPVTILIVAVAVVIFLVTNVVPTFIGIFTSTGGTLPLPTVILLAVSAFIRSFWWLLLLGAAGLVYAIYTFKKSRSGKALFDRLILKLPVLGKMLKKVYLGRFASTLNILLGSGVDLLSALTIVEDVLNNQLFAQVLTAARGQVREGVVFSQPLGESGLFPGMVVQMIRVGEEAGSLEKMLHKIANFYDREVEASVESTISLIEPLMIVFLAVIVGFIVIAVVMPMFDMFQYF